MTRTNSPTLEELIERHRTREVTLMTPAEVAARFGVNAKTVTRWARDGKLTCIRTLGGHRRFAKAEVEQLRVEQPRNACCHPLPCPMTGCRTACVTPSGLREHLTHRHRLRGFEIEDAVEASFARQALQAAYPDTHAP